MGIISREGLTLSSFGHFYISSLDVIIAADDFIRQQIPDATIVLFFLLFIFP